MSTTPRLARASLLAVLTASSLMAGCSSDDDDDDVGTDSPVQEAAADAGIGAEPEDVLGDDDPAGEPAAPGGDELRTRATGIVRDVLDTVDGVASAPVPMPDVVVETSPSLIYYLSTIDGDSVVVVPRWEDLREGQGLFEEWAATTGGAYDGRALFEELFNWFFVAHETGHLLQTVSEQGPETRWVQEIQANEIAVAHFAATEPARLDALVAALAPVLASFDVPEGAGDPEFFGRAYEAISEVPEIYGYFQFGFILDAYDRADKLDLTTIARDDLAL